MHTTAFATLPLPYSKACDTFRPRIGQHATIRAGLGGKSFIDFLVPRAMPNGLVREHVAEGRPACIKNGFRHAGLGESGSVHVAHCDVIELLHDAVRELMEKVGPTVGDSSVNASGLPFLSRSLSLSERAFKLAEVSGVLDPLAIRECGKFFQAQIYPDARGWRSGLLVSHFNHDVQEPVAASVTREVCSILDLTFREQARVKHSIRASIEAKSIALALKVASLYRYPSKRSAPSISEIWALMLNAAPGVLLTHRVNGVGADAQLLTAACRQVVQVKATQPFAAPLKRIFLAIIAVIPDEIYRPGLLIQ